MGLLLGSPWSVIGNDGSLVSDHPGAGTIEDLRADLARRGIVFAMARVKPDLRVELSAAELVERIGEDRIFPTLPTAVAALREHVR